MALRGFGSILVVIGAYLLIRVPHLDPDSRVEMSTAFAASLVTLGIMVLIYSELHSQTSLREYRRGRDLSNRMASILIAVGIGLMAFGVVYLVGVASLGFGPDSIWAVMVLLLLSNILIAASLLRRPKTLFATEGNEEPETSVSKRRLVGGMTILIGFAFEAIAPVCFITYGDSSLLPQVVGLLFAWLFGPIMIFGGIATVWGPMMRPWKQGSTKGLRAEERTDEAD